MFILSISGGDGRGSAVRFLGGAMGQFYILSRFVYIYILETLL